jgi:ankyrin repeat protein
MRKNLYENNDCIPEPLTPGDPARIGARQRRISVWLALLILLPGIAPLAITIVSLLYNVVQYKILENTSQKVGWAIQVTAAARTANVDELRRVLDADPAALRDPLAKGVLYLAAENPNGLRTVALLLARGADPNMRSQNGRKAIHAYPGNPEIVKLLMMNGQKLDIFAAAGHGMLPELRRLIAEKPSSVNSRGPGALTALEHAAEANQLLAARLLIENNAQVDIISAARFAMLDSISALLAKDSALANAYSSANTYGTPLHAAILAHSPSAVELLIRAGARTKQTQYNYLQISAEQKQVEISRMILASMTDSNDIAGRVTDINGNGIAAANIDAWTWYTGHETLSNSLGFFLLQRVPSDGNSAELRVSAQGFSPFYTTRQRLGQCDCNFMLDDKTFIYGRALGPDLHPAGGVKIRANQGPKEADGVIIKSVWSQAVTDANGNYRLYLASDSYEIRAEYPGGEIAQTGRHLISTGSKTRMDFSPLPAASAHFKFLDSQTSAPLSDVLVSGSSNPANYVSDANGRVVIKGLRPGRHSFMLDCHGYARWWPAGSKSAVTNFGFERNFDLFDIDVDEKNSDEIIVYLEKGAAFSGIVQDPCGNRVSNAVVTAALTGTGNSLTGDTRFSTFTDFKGDFKLLLPAGKDVEYNLFAHQGSMHNWLSFANGVTGTFKTQPGSIFKNVIITLSKPEGIRGRVVRHDGSAAASIRLRATAADFLENRYYDPSAVSDANGFFTLNFLRPGSHYIQAEPFWLDPRHAPKNSVRLIKVGPAAVPGLIELITEK